MNLEYANNFFYSIEDYTQAAGGQGFTLDLMNETQRVLKGVLKDSSYHRICVEISVKTDDIETDTFLFWNYMIRIGYDEKLQKIYFKRYMVLDYSKGEGDDYVEEQYNSDISYDFVENMSVYQIREHYALFTLFMNKCRSTVKELYQEELKESNEK